MYVFFSRNFIPLNILLPMVHPAEKPLCELLLAGEKPEA
jgi:hypothetical protein